MRPDFEYPDWKFEGWVKDDKPVQTWLRGELRVNNLARSNVKP